MSDTYSAYEHEFERILTQYYFTTEEIETIYKCLKEKKVLIRNLVEAAAKSSIETFKKFFRGIKANDVEIFHERDHILVDICKTFHSTFYNLQIYNFKLNESDRDSKKSIDFFFQEVWNFILNVNNEKEMKLDEYKEKYSSQIKFILKNLQGIHQDWNWKNEFMNDPYNYHLSRMIYILGHMINNQIDLTKFIEDMEKKMLGFSMKFQGKRKDDGLDGFTKLWYV